MNICFTLSSLSAGGAERVATLLANSFTSAGHHVSLILVSIDYNNSFYQLSDLIDVIPLIKTKKDKNFFRRINILKRKIIEIKPDIVISFLPHICIYTYFALKKTNIPFICSERNDPKQYGFLYKMLLKRAFKYANGCVFQTSSARRFYRTVKDNNAVIIYNPVCLKLSETAVVKAEKDKVFISAGRLVPQKNFQMLINSFNLFSKSRPDYKLIIYGDGPLRHELLMQINNLGIDKNVSLPGNNPNWHDMAINASCFISTSNFEGMPNCLEEALCLGCPSIATDCPAGGSKDLISLLGHGVLINLNDEEQLVSKMIDISDGKYPFRGVDYSVLKPENISKQWLSFMDKVLKAK